jgi:hypothetical protein
MGDTATPDNRVIPGSVVQINERASAPCYVGCLLLVSKVLPWGIQGLIAVPREMEAPAAEIWLRPTWDAIEYIGEAVMVPTSEARDDG